MLHRIQHEPPLDLSRYAPDPWARNYLIAYLERAHGRVFNDCILVRHDLVLAGEVAFPVYVIAESRYSAEVALRSHGFVYDAGHENRVVRTEADIFVPINLGLYRCASPDEGAPDHVSLQWKEARFAAPGDVAVGPPHPLQALFNKEG